MDKKSDKFKRLAANDRLNKLEVLGVYVLEQLEELTEICRELRETKPRKKSLINRRKVDKS